MKIKPTKLEFRLNFSLPAFLFCILSMGSPMLTAQESQDTIPEGDRYSVVERMPQYPGGVEELLSFLKKNVYYPPKAKKKGIQGMVVLQFTVERDGSISNTKIVERIGGGCDEVALAAIKKMPKWSPGLKEGGVPVRVQYRLPIGFHLN
ncbi:energy transducer TonB [Haliscomenobacter hydrossis]|uniref:TonB family protein n=1 Tax=Haliscomenobacter hydrossis (strain ATCC 27775 / DSM 1100 / LMG 10767 / O) TaxID=760192 RepID=F4KS09_HALH1|nr:energy transducer TonB [Haliscomenobacter hydrossis]AEE51096.1 TonB family protein [Haliscomenobacter hydrossis DSM 1100]